MHSFLTSCLVCLRSFPAIFPACSLPCSQHLQGLKKRTSMNSFPRARTCFVHVFAHLSVFFLCVMSVPFIPRTGIKSEPWQVIVDSLMPAAMVYNYTWQEVRIPGGAINIFLGSWKTTGVDSGETTSKAMLSRNGKAWLKRIVVKRNSWKQCLLTLCQ